MNVLNDICGISFKLVGVASIMLVSDLVVRSQDSLMADIIVHLLTK